MNKLTSLLKLIPERHRVWVAIVGMLCATNYANHAYHQSDEDEQRGTFEKIVQEAYAKGCK